MGRCLDFGCGTGRGSGDANKQKYENNISRQTNLAWDFFLEICEGWSNLVHFVWNNAGIMCWISPEAFSAFKACREVMGGRREVMGGMDDVIASNLDQCFSPFLWLIPPKKIFKIERPWERNLMFFLGEWNFLLRNLDHESLRELSIYMKLKLKEIRWCSDKWKVHSI